MTALPPAQPLPFRLLLDEAVRHTRHHFKAIYPAVAIPLTLFSSLIPLAQWRMFRGLPGEGETVARPGEMLQGFALFWVVMVVWMVVYYLSYAVLLGAAVDAMAQKPIAMGRIWRSMVRPRTLGTLFLMGLATALGFSCCVLPGIYVSLLFAFTVPVMVDEGLLGTAAMRRSADLARYNPQRAFDADPRFKVFVIVFVGFLLGYAINMLVQLPLLVVQQVMMARDIAGGRHMDPAAAMARTSLLQVPAQMLGMLTNTAVYLYVSFGLALLYVDVKRRREGSDLVAAIEQIVRSHLRPMAAAATSPAPTPETPGS